MTIRPAQGLDRASVLSYRGAIVSELINLEWHGPLTFGSFPESKEEVSKLKLSAVYIFFRCYEGFKGKTLVYVGKTQNFVERLAGTTASFLVASTEPCTVRMVRYSEMEAYLYTSNLFKEILIKHFAMR